MILIKKLSRIDKDLAFYYYDRAAGTYRGTWDGDWSPSTFGDDTFTLFQASKGEGADYTYY